MKHRIVIAVLVPLFAVGCAQTSMKVTYRSDPPYASVYARDGTYRGVCPLTLWYPVDAEARAQGHLYAKGMTMRWVSGAEKTSRETIKITVDGTNRQVTFVRPKDAPNAHIDAAYAEAWKTTPPCPQRDGNRKTTRICFKPATEPADAIVVYRGQRYGHNFCYEIMEKDAKRGRLVVPELTLEREGYVPYIFPSTEIKLSEQRGAQRYDSSLLKFIEWDCRSDGSLCTARYTNAEKIVLKKDPDYRGPVQGQD